MGDSGISSNLASLSTSGLSPKSDLTDGSKVVVYFGAILLLGAFYSGVIALMCAFYSGTISMTSAFFLQAQSH